jgi:hypothetical protein
MSGFLTSDFYLYDPADFTKQLKFDTSALTTGTLRKLSVQGFPGAITSQTIPALELPNVFTANNNFYLGATFTNNAGATTPITLDTSHNTTNAIDLITTSGVGSSSGDPTFMNVNGHIAADHFVLANLADNTKQVAYDVSDVATGTTNAFRHLNIPGSPVMVGRATGSGSGILGAINVTAKTADIASANIVASAPAGFYRISYVLADTTADGAAGSVILTISWTDDVGATTATATQILTGTGRVSGTVPLYLASGNIMYATTHTGSYGTAQYALRIRAEFLG